MIEYFCIYVIKWKWQIVWFFLEKISSTFLQDIFYNNNDSNE